MKKISLWLFIFFINFSAIAKWEYNTDTDQMRGSTSYLATITEKPINSARSGDLTIVVASEDDKSASGAGIYFIDDKFDCEGKKYCNVSVKFNNGKVLEKEVRISNSRYLAYFTDGLEFVESFKMANSFYIEVPVTGKGLVQYKFDPSGIKWSGVLEEGEYITSIGNINFIDYKINSSANIYVNDRGHNCQREKDFHFGANKKLIGDASICFSDGKLIYIEIDNILVKRNDLITEINKARKDNEELNGDVRIWFNSNGDKYLSSIFMSKGSKQGYQIHISYKPNVNVYVK